VVRTPSSRRSRKKLISSSVKTSGSAPTSPSTCPTSRSARVSVGSTCGVGVGLFRVWLYQATATGLSAQRLPHNPFCPRQRAVHIWENSFKKT
jgi:hypothetical protein